MASTVSRFATNIPTSTPQIRSQKTVISITAYISAAVLIESRWARSRKLQSMMSSPTLIRIPASKAVGISAAIGPAPRSTSNSTTE